jgi:hypothetical protein
MKGKVISTPFFLPIITLKDDNLENWKELSNERIDQVSAAHNFLKSSEGYLDQNRRLHSAVNDKNLIPSLSLPGHLHFAATVSPYRHILIWQACL